MNLMFTTFCNQRCVYCFGQDAMASAGKCRAEREVSRDNLQVVLDLCKRSRQGSINIIGGEPTLHSRFQERYEQIEASGLKVLLFSNGVMKPEHAEFLGKRGSLGYLMLNIREPWEYSARDWAAVRNTLAHVKQTVLSFRIYRLGFDPTFMFDLIDEFGLQRDINFAPALPSLDTKTVYLGLGDYPQMGREMVRWSKVSARRKINWYPDAGFITCGFTKPGLRALKENVNFEIMANCPSAVEVRPDLTCQRCFGMWSKGNERPVSIEKFRTVQEAHQAFDVCSKRIKGRHGALPECRDCADFHAGRCGGGCMVHILKRLRGTRLYRSRIFDP